MSFVDTLRGVRTSPTTALHEFLAEYNPTARRIHVFVEGEEDKVFYREHIGRFAPRDRVIRPHRCGNKVGVYEVFNKIKERNLSVRDVYWCVDKDLADFLGENGPVDPAIFTTDFYAIENYFVNLNVVEHVCTNLMRMRNVVFDAQVIREKFERESKEFNRRMQVLMAWIIYQRRRGSRPNLRNVVLGEVLRFSNDCSIGIMPRRLEYLARVTGVQHVPGCGRDLRRIIRHELRDCEPKLYVRGKFDLWFLVNFLKQLRELLDSTAGETGGSVAWAVQIEVGNAIAVLSSAIDTPAVLRDFLTRFYPEQLEL